MLLTFKKVISLFVCSMCLLGSGSLLMQTQPVHAQDLGSEIADQLKAAGTASGNTKGPADPRVLIILIIKRFLQFMGIIMLVLMLYAGFLWMTAAGDESKIEKSKSIISSAIIGLAIIIMSYSIVVFVVYALTGYGSFGIPGLPPGAPGDLPRPPLPGI